MKLGRRFLTQSLVVRLGIAFAAIAALTLSATLSATIFAELATGKAAAINVAGSLRMQSYWITVQVLRSSKDGPPSSELSSAITEFEKRLTSSQLMSSVPSAAADPIRNAYDRVSSQWSGTIKSAIVRATSSEMTRDEFVSYMAAYVRDVDQLVRLLEHELEGRIQSLRVVQGATLFATIVVTFIALYLLHTQVIVPMGDLLQCASRVRGGDFKVRVQHTGRDELGQLGQSFNYMVEDLSHSYANLETRVEEKTEQLARSNVSLELLYNTTRRLAENPLTKSTLEEVMQTVERAIGIEAGVICAREENDPRGSPIVLKEESWHASANCAECFGDGRLAIRVVGSGEGRRLSVPLTEAGKPRGVMLMRLPPDVELDDWKLKPLESIGHHIGAALGAARQAEEKNRLALLEERSVIARELHDSLAQSLSYLDIQVTRLKLHHAANGDGQSTARSATQTREIVDELKLGLKNAYRQLRELLTTFRLGMDGRGLSDALEEAVREFSRRTDTEFRLHNKLIGHELDSGEQIHVLQVVREALNNVEHHAQAQHADIRLIAEQGRVRVIVEDDGIGISAGSPRENHYGLAIMRDRAVSLGGRMRISRRTEGGTRVELEFAPRGPYHAGKPSPLPPGVPPGMERSEALTDVKRPLLQ